jgi:hypothetical protein
MFPKSPLLGPTNPATPAVREFLTKGIVLEEQMHELAAGPSELWLHEQVLQRLYSIRDRLIGPPAKRK